VVEIACGTNTDFGTRFGDAAITRIWVLSSVSAEAAVRYEQQDGVIWRLQSNRIGDKLQLD